MYTDKDLSYIVDQLAHMPADADRWAEYTSALKSVRDAANEEIAALRADLAAQVWRPVARTVLVKGQNFCTIYKDEVVVLIEGKRSPVTFPFPPSKALCELVAAGEGDA